jgi:hypothetical protein
VLKSDFTRKYSPAISGDNDTDAKAKVAETVDI